MALSTTTNAAINQINLRLVCFSAPTKSSTGVTTMTSHFLKNLPGILLNRATYSLPSDPSSKLKRSTPNVLSKCTAFTTCGTSSSDTFANSTFDPECRTLLAITG